MRLSFSIMAHPSRAHFVSDLLPQIPGAVVVYDEKQDRWDTGRRAMLTHPPDADWGVTIQDDALLAPNFVARTHAALEHAGSGPVAFYTGKGWLGGTRTDRAVRLALQRQASWLLAPGPMWGVAVAVRPADIGPMIAWGDENTDVANYDVRMACYFTSIGRMCRYSVPSLVDHRVGPENPSLIEGRGSSRGRTAQYFIGGHRVRWSARAYALPRTGEMDA